MRASMAPLPASLNPSNQTSSALSRLTATSANSKGHSTKIPYDIAEERELRCGLFEGLSHQWYTPEPDLVGVGQRLNSRTALGAELPTW